MGLDLNTVSDERGLTKAPLLQTIFQRSRETDCFEVSESRGGGVTRSVVSYIMRGQCNKSHDTESSSGQYFTAEQTTQCVLRHQRRATYRTAMTNVIWKTITVFFWSGPAVPGAVVVRSSTKQSCSTPFLSTYEPIEGLQVDVPAMLPGFGSH